MKRIVLSMTLIAACAVPSLAEATPRPVVPPSGSTTLNSYSRGSIPTAETSFNLPKGVWYVATVSGTVSYYSPINYTKPQPPYKIVCGAPQTGSQGPVGLDAEFTFARPWTRSKCQRAHLPIHWDNFQASTGSAWAHPKTLGPVPSAPTSNHTYNYVLLGRNKPAQFRLTDIYYRDNDGKLHISVRPATAADCGDYYSFGFTSSPSCASAFAPLI
jgi:hypothetical protein